MARSLTRITLFLAVPLLLLGIAPNLDAQLRFGPEIAIADDWDFGIGGRVTGDVDVFDQSESSALRSLRGIGQFLYYPDPICDSCNAWEINLNGALPVTISGSDADFYAGAGLNIANFSSDAGSGFSDGDTEVGVNLIGGLNFNLGNLAAFTEAGIRLEGSEQFVFGGGLVLGGTR